MSMPRIAASKSAAVARFMATSCSVPHPLLSMMSRQAPTTVALS